MMHAKRIVFTLTSALSFIATPVVAAAPESNDLYSAVSNGNAKQTEALLKAGADANQRRFPDKPENAPGNFTALYTATVKASTDKQHDHYAAIAFQLLKYGANPNMPSYSDNSRLAHALYPLTRALEHTASVKTYKKGNSSYSTALALITHGGACSDTAISELYATNFKKIGYRYQLQQYLVRLYTAIHPKVAQRALLELAPFVPCKEKESKKPIKVARLIADYLWPAPQGYALDHDMKNFMQANPLQLPATMALQDALENLFETWNPGTQAFKASTALRKYQAQRALCSRASGTPTFNPQGNHVTDVPGR